MTYNTSREHLILPEYGRNVQNMVNYALTIQDCDERQQCAETIIQIMASKIPQQKDAEEQLRMLWDHLALISGYKLDVVSPYPINIPTNEGLEHPRLNYPDAHPRFKHYGHTLEQMISHLSDIPEGEERQSTIFLVVTQMAKSLYQWDRNALNPEKLADDVALLTDGKIQLNLTEDEMHRIMTIAASQPKSINKSKKKRK